MEVVVDTNVIISALLRDGLTRRILLLAPFEMYTVPFAKQEIEKHKGELLHKSGLDEDSFGYLLDLIFAKINVVDREVLEPFRKRAGEILKDIDPADAPTTFCIPRSSRELSHLSAAIPELHRHLY